MYQNTKYNLYNFILVYMYLFKVFSTKGDSNNFIYENKARLLFEVSIKNGVLIMISLFFFYFKK